jgi:hypothetical protein
MNFRLRYCFRFPGVNSRAELVPSRPEWRSAPLARGQSLQISQGYILLFLPSLLDFVVLAELKI